MATTGDFERNLRLGIQHDIIDFLIEDWITRFREALPETSFYIEPDYSGQITTDLLVGKLDLAFVFTPKPLPDLYFEPVGQVEFVMVSSDTDQRERVTGDRFIYASYSPLFEQAQRLAIPDWQDAPIASGHISAIGGLLASQGGTAYVMANVAEDLVRRKICRRIVDAEPIEQMVYMASHIRHRHAAIPRKLLSIVKKAFRSG